MACILTLLCRFSCHHLQRDFCISHESRSTCIAIRAIILQGPIVHAVHVSRLYTSILSIALTWGKSTLLAFVVPSRDMIVHTAGLLLMAGALSSR